MISLDSDQVHLFYVKADKINDTALLKEYESVLSREEREKVGRYRFEKDRHLSLVSRALVRYLLSAYTGRAPEYFSFFCNSFGKPAILKEQADRLGLDIKFNLSHTPGAVVLGLGITHEIGVDVEQVDRSISLGVADRFFSKKEAEMVRQYSGSRRHQILFDIWTLKEAYIKARAKGLSIPLDSFSFDLGPQDRIKFTDPAGTGEGWQFFRWRPGQNLTIAAAVESRFPINFSHYHCVPFDRIQPV
ncbi:MAG: 4'-phosphopantetheinyl transferase superfamily protein [Desulfobacter sp.]|nr:4'-phosphopantetheinyl transferase superfamily protein [Desulfobacter sp.]WDP87063.1 MAG: 4'-phosphopantetheinyl transferase superfamily protein [Desulfobacter sp.]